MVPRRENQRDARRLSSEEKLGEVSCSREDCYHRGFVAAHEKIMKEVPLRKWVEFLRDEGEAYDQEVINFCASGV